MPRKKHHASADRCDQLTIETRNFLHARTDVKVTGKLVKLVNQSGEGNTVAMKATVKPTVKGTVKSARPAGTRLPPLTWAEATVTMTLAGGWRFEFPEVESANRLWRAAKGRTYKSARATSDTAHARLRWRHITPLTGPVTVTIAWHRARKSGDLDNKCKGTLDLLRQIAYADDAQVCEIRMSRHDDADERPRLAVWVDPYRPHGLELHR